jgi:hypothetical protein
MVMQMQNPSRMMRTALHNWARRQWPRVERRVEASKHGRAVSCICAALVMNGCAIVATERVGSSPVAGGPGTTGVPYLLPKALLPLELIVNGAQVRVDILEPIYVGDPEHAYVLRYDASAFSSDTVTLEVDPKTSLLKSVTLISKDETGEVLKKAIATFVRAESAAGPGDTVLLQTMLDPSDPATIAAVRAQIDAALDTYLKGRQAACSEAPAEPECRKFSDLPNQGVPATLLEVKPMGSTEARAAMAAARPDCSIGICHRATVPYRIDMSLFGQGRTTVVQLPNHGPILALALQRHAFVQSQHTATLNNGMLQKYEAIKPSSALALVSWPLDVYDAVVKTTAQIVQLKIDTSRTSNTLREELLKEEKRRLALEKELKALKEGPREESARLFGARNSNVLLTVGTGTPSTARPKAEPGFKTEGDAPSAPGAGQDPAAPSKTLPGSSGG